jgi:hypothetical protein
MASEKIFNGTVAYLKIATGFGAAQCLLVMFFVGFDPWHSLDGLIWTDLYGSAELPAAAKPAFSLAILLFSWLSVLMMAIMHLVARYPLARKEKWAYWAYVLIGIFWPLGGAIITCYTHAWSYFASVAIMTLMFLPPVVLLFPHFRK